MLLAAGFKDREHGFHETAARGTLGSEGEFPPNHSVA